MSHVDEGQLHAYLDGALSAMDAVRVERHVADCEPCRLRLEESRRLVQRAARLLEWATPPERAMPPLADLRPPVAPRWRAPVAWAATIVLALGIGTYSGYRFLRPTPRMSEEKMAPKPTAPPVRARVDSPQVALNRQARRDSAAAAPSAETSAPVALGRAVDSAPAPRVDSTPPLAAADARKLQDSAKTAAVTPPAEVAARREAAPSAAAPRPEPLSLARDPIRAAITTGTTWPSVTRDSAARLLGSPIAIVPDLLVVSTRASGDAVMVEQLVPPGQLIRLIERKATAAMNAPGESRGATEALARFVGSLRVEIVGALPADSLSRLLERVR